MPAVSTTPDATTDRAAEPAFGGTPPRCASGAIWGTRLGPLSYVGEEVDFVVMSGDMARLHHGRQVRSMCADRRLFRRGDCSDVSADLLAVVGSAGSRSEQL